LGAEGQTALVWARAPEDTEGADVNVVWEVAMSTPTLDRLNWPIEFHEVVGARGHRLFAIFDHLSAGEEAVQALRFEGFADEDIWLFCGEEGSRRLDVTGRAHGIRARVLRMIEFALSSDFKYLRTLDEALHHGRIVIAVRAKDESTADDIARLLRMFAGHSIAYCSHWDFVPDAT